MAARSEKALLDLRMELLSSAQNGQLVHILTVDLRESEAIASILGTARTLGDRLEVLVNNAAILGPIGRLWENNWQEGQETIQINLVSSHRTMREN